MHKCHSCFQSHVLPLYPHYFPRVGLGGRTPRIPVEVIDWITFKSNNITINNELLEIGT